MNSLNGKVAVVTGASKGIGAAIAAALAADGAAVVVNYAGDAAGAARVVSRIEAAGGKALAVQGDVSKAADVARLFDATKQAFGRLDVLVNNAGVYAFAAVEDTTAAEFQRQYGINVLGLLQVTAAASPLFGPDGGSIINIGSVASTLGMAGTAIYAGTKGAVDAITRVLAAELAPRKIRVNSINPGGVETEGVAAMTSLTDEAKAQMVARTPLARIGQPDDIAKVASFLASDQSGWLTGEILFASGGQR